MSALGYNAKNAERAGAPFAGSALRMADGATNSQSRLLGGTRVFPPAAISKRALGAVLTLSVGCVSPGPTRSSSPPTAPAASLDAATPALVYPSAPRGSVVDVFHGVSVADPYRWLESSDSPETRAWVTAENQLTDAHLANSPGLAILRSRLAALASYGFYRPPMRRGHRYFWIQGDGKRDQPVLATSDSLEAASHLLVDFNVISPDGKLALADVTVSHDGETIGYGMSDRGGDWTTWHLRKVGSDKDGSDALEFVKYYPPAFSNDGKGLYFSRFPAPAAGQELTETDHDCALYYHEVGTPSSHDQVVYKRPDHPSWQFEPQVTEDGRYLVITIGDGEVGDRGLEQLAYADLHAPGHKVVTLVDTFDAEYEFVGNDGPIFFVKTTFGAPNKRIVAIDTRHPARAGWKQVVAAGPEAIDDARVVGHQLLVTTLKDVHHAVTAYDLAGRKLRDLELPGMGTVFGFRGGPDDKETSYYFTSFTTPGSVYRYDLASGRSTLWKQPEIPFDASTVETRQVFFSSKDGTKVPMFIVSKKGTALNDKNPTLLTGYGCGGYSMTPFFDSAQLTWIEHGGVFALANIRGGGEYGENWRHQADHAQKQKSFDDFIAAGEWLVANHYTSPEHLGMFGHSGGGLLVGAVLTQRPDLFGAAVPLSGDLDMLRFPLFGQGVGWEEDLGDPQNAEDFAGLYAYSPVHNVKPRTHFPATLVVTADNDVRVAPFHSYKFAAALQAAQTGAAPVLLRVETMSGHGGGTTVSSRVEQQAEWLAFFAQHLGLSTGDPSP